jgi:protein-S-isoprenylcysteine O-methyltransferase Ste14
MSDRLKAVIGSVVFLFVAPGILAVLIPWWTTGWVMHEPFLGFEPFRWLGVLLIAGGALILLDSFRRFALEGRGTPAPVYPTETLVVTGSYRFVRNPMYVAVVSLILGQGLLFGNVAVLVYGLVGWLTVHLFVLAYEEPTLSRTYGAQYDRYRANVRRWLPRLTPWKDQRRTDATARPSR